MKTMVQIVQDLLDKSLITAEEAVTLLTPQKEYVYPPYYTNQWIKPYSPTSPNVPRITFTTSSNEQV